MKPCATASEYRASSLGRYHVGSHFVIWHARTDLSGFAAWGRPGADAAASLCHLLDTALGAPHFSLLDVRGLLGVDYAAFDVFFRGIRDRQEGFARSILKQGILRPEGAVGAVVLGFYGLMPHGYPVKHFTALEDAVAWFGVDDRASLLRELYEMNTAAQGVPEIAARLRAHIAATHGRSSPKETARILGMSARTLQRRLEAIGTSLRDELHNYRVARTKVLLVETQGSLLSIAESVGFESVRTLNDVFRKHTGMTPREFRDARRSPLGGG